IAAGPRLVRSRITATTRATRPTSDGPEGQRKRKARANRILTVLKAALNYAYHTGKAKSDEAWRRVKPFPRVDVPVVRYLSADEVRRLTNACGPEFRSLVQAGLLTGCRYGELTRCHVGDLNFDSWTLTIRDSKSGKPRHVVLADDGQALFASL